MIERIYSEMNLALKAGDKKTASALRLLYSTLKTAQIDAGGSLDDEKSMAVIKKEMKKRVEARDLYAANDRQEQAAQEEFERSLYSQYVPAELSADKIDEIIASVAKELDDIKFASIMPAVMKQTAGQADGRLVSERVKNYLNQQEPK